jgi:hypothetical protein
MKAADARRAVAAAISTASALDLAVDDAVVLSDSNRLVVRLMPCDTVARVTPMTHDLRAHGSSAEREVDLANRLTQTNSPVATLEGRVGPRVVERDGFDVTLWTYFEPVKPPVVAPFVYAHALEVLHEGLRRTDLSAPHFSDRITTTREAVANRDVTPELAASDRALLADTLSDLSRSIIDRRAPEQLLHGEPHPWNVLTTEHGPLFIDLENTAEGPIEYDIAWVPDDVSKHYANTDRDLLDDCRGVVLAIVAMHRWSRDDQHPSGRESGVAFLDALRVGPPWPTLDAVEW